MKHLEFEKLVNNFEGLLSINEALAIAEHLQNCPQCAAQADKLEDFFNYVKSEKHAPVPQALTARLLNVFNPRKKTAPTKKSIGERILAHLVFDDWQTALGERLAVSDTRQMLFQAGDFSIDLRLQFAGGRCNVSGQIFPECAPGSSVEIFSETARETVSVNEFCEFIFPPLPAGVYIFRLISGGANLEIENLSLIG